MKKFIQQKKKLIIWIGFFFLLLGSLFLFYDFYRGFQIRKIQSPLSNEQLIKNNDKAHENDKQDIKDMTIEEYSYENVSVPTLIEVLEANNSNYDQQVISRLTIPSVEIDLNIYQGATHTNLIYGVGTLLNPSVIGKGNYALAGHNMNDSGVLLSNLVNIQLGELMTVTDGKKQATYKVTSAKEMNKKDVQILDQSDKPILTLLTCLGGANTPRRWVVIGELQGKVTAVEESKEKKEKEKYQDKIETSTSTNKEKEQDKILNNTKKNTWVSNRQQVIMGVISIALTIGVIFIVVVRTKKY